LKSQQSTITFQEHNDPNDIWRSEIMKLFWTSLVLKYQIWFDLWLKTEVKLTNFVADYFYNWIIKLLLFRPNEILLLIRMWLYKKLWPSQTWNTWNNF
jgi:hypothetical protein